MYVYIFVVNFPVLRFFVFFFYVFRWGERGYVLFELYIIALLHNMMPQTLCKFQIVCQTI